MRCPDCGKGRVVLARLNSPTVYSCGHKVPDTGTRGAPDPVDAREFAIWVIERRLAKRLTQTELGQLIGKSQSEMSRLEKGFLFLNPDLVRKLRDVLERG